MSLRALSWFLLVRLIRSDTARGTFFEPAGKVTPIRGAKSWERTRFEMVIASGELMMIGEAKV